MAGAYIAYSLPVLWFIALFLFIHKFQVWKQIYFIYGDHIQNISTQMLRYLPAKTFSINFPHFLFIQQQLKTLETGELNYLTGSATIYFILKVNIPLPVVFLEAVRNSQRTLALTVLQTWYRCECSRPTTVGFVILITSCWWAADPVKRIKSAIIFIFVLVIESNCCSLCVVSQKYFECFLEVCQSVAAASLY